MFPETFIPTYPDWVWRLPAWRDGLYVERLYCEAVTVPGPTVDQLATAALEADAYVAVGVNELDGGTLYNSLLYFGPEGDCSAGIASSCRQVANARSGAIRIPDTVGAIHVVADLRASKITVYIDVDAPKSGRASTRVNWLVRQLKDAPARFASKLLQ